MLCQVHTHLQLSYVVIVGIDVIYYCYYLHWFSPAAAEHFSVHSSRHISVRSFHTFQRGSFSAPRTILVLSYSNYCFSSPSVRCGRCVVRVLSPVVAHIFIKCYPSRTSSGGFCRKVTYATMAVGTEGSCPAQLLTYHAGLAHSKLCYLTHKPAICADL